MTKKSQSKSKAPARGKVLAMPKPKPAPAKKSLKKSAKSTAPDLTKFGVFDLDVHEDYRPLLVALYDERNKAKVAEDCAIEIRKALDEQIESVLDDTGYSRIFMPDGNKIVQANGRSAAKLEAKLLIEHGVDPDLIPKCTVPGNAYTYIQVVKQSDDDLRTIQMLEQIRARTNPSTPNQEGA